MTGSALLIHIGTHKTGSTILQTTVLPAVRDALYIPRNTKLSLVINTLANSTLPMIYSDEIISGVINKHRAYLNTDYITSQRKNISTLAQYFPEAYIILLLREPSEWLQSMYFQYLQTGGIETFEAWLECNETLVQYENLLEACEKQFGAHLLVFDYDQLKTCPLRIIEVIEAKTGIAFDKEKVVTGVANHKSNPSVSRLGARVLRQCNKWVRTFRHPKGENKIGSVLPRLKLAPRDIIRRWPLIRILNRVGNDVVSDDERLRLKRKYAYYWADIKGRIEKTQTIRQQRGHNVADKSR